ncbi:hypothetical protein Tco_0184276 [Tanacetum coccineum]
MGYENHSKINTQYGLPPLLPYFEPIQPHTQDRYEPLDDDTELVSEDKSEIKMEKRMVRQDKENEEDALIDILKSLLKKKGTYWELYGTQGVSIFLAPLQRSRFYDDESIDTVDLNDEMQEPEDGHKEEKCKNFHDTTYRWHDEGFEEEEQWESGIEKTYYEPSFVKSETFEVKRYSFKNGKSFVCITKQLDDALPLGRVNSSRFISRRRWTKMEELLGNCSLSKE